MGQTSSTTNTLYSVNGSSQTDIWAVGSRGTTLYNNGTSPWGLEPPSIGSGVANDLRAVWDTSKQDVWTVGSAGMALHWAGSSWGAPAPAGTTNTFYSFWRSNTPDVNIWAVGDQGTVVHANSTAAQLVASGTSRALYSVWGFGETDVWAVGDLGIMLHYRKM